MARDLKTDMETLRTVLSLAQNRDFQRAGALAERTLAEGFEHPVLLNVLATRLEQEGRYEESLRLLQRAVTISPTDVGARNALSLCLQRLDRPAEALLHVDELLLRHPELGFVHVNRGNALVALGALGTARRSHLRALELEPENLSAMTALASIATHRGEHAEARRWAEHVLNAVPGMPDAVLSLAAAQLAAGEIGAAEQSLQKLILDMRAGPTDRARAVGLLGDVLDAAGRYGDAFAAYQACNEGLRQIHSRFASQTGTQAYARLLNVAIGRIGADRWKHAAPVADDGAIGHVFLLGFPRSGTTLLEVVLDGHPNVAAVEEHELLTDAVLRFMREPIDLEPLVTADEAELAALRTAYWGRVRDAGVAIDGKVFIDKHPLNTLKLPLIARLFPRAKILFAQRDPRDVVFSCFRRRFKMNAAMYELLTLDGAAGFYDAVMTCAGLMQPVLGPHFRTVRYEALVTDFACETRSICDFLGLAWIPDMGDFGARVQAREHATPSTAQLARGLERSSIDQWRHYATRLEPLLAVLGPWIERFRYPP